ncbi:phosphotransferase [Streptomyces sp. CS227]|uniref:phosphotransferase n=1 Tax=Streptomyces sp. CS227 TaxID=1982763 RepID=UPI00211B43D2|nr:phosphotransferase [Streptomyces sp. CS227]
MGSGLRAPACPEPQERSCRPTALPSTPLWSGAWWTPSSRTGPPAADPAGAGRVGPCDPPARGRADRAAAAPCRGRRAGAATAEVFDAAAMSQLWEAALAAPEWHRPPVWFHGDFHTGNLLVTGGRLSAVIDFGGFGAGDPARDMMIAHTLLSPPGPAPSSARPWTWTTRPGCAAAGGPWRRG